MVIAVKKYSTRKGKKYGPYPKDPDLFYLYQVYRDKETGKVKQRYLGKGPKPK